MALAAFLPTNAEAIPAYPWSAGSEPVVAEPPFAGLLGMVPAAPAFIMPAPTPASVANSDNGQHILPTMRSGGGLATIICAYDWDCEKALRVAACESGPDLWAEGGYYVGTFQIDPALHGWRGDIYTPEGNVAVAYQLWQEQGWAPWPICGWR